MLRSIVAPIRTRLNPLRYPVVRQYLPLLLLTSVLFVALALLDKKLPDAQLKVVAHFAWLFCISLAFGVLLAWLFEKKIFQNRSTAQRSLLVLAVVIWGMVLFFALTQKNLVYQRLYLPTLGLVSFPWFCWRAIQAVAGVPQLRFAPFVFDSLKDVVAAFRFAENAALGIRWVFESDFFEVDVSGNYIFRTFVPNDVRDQPLGQLFKGVISLHNITEVPQKPIDFQISKTPQKSDNLSDTPQKPAVSQRDKNFYGWEFYDYPYWWWPQRKRFLDPYKSIRKNGMRFWRISEEERLKSVVKLLPKFRAARVYVRRSKT